MTTVVKYVLVSEGSNDEVCRGEPGYVLMIGSYFDRNVCKSVSVYLKLISV